ncbi:MAG: S1 RNA-binding domain-containing protein [Oscillospiraceae bacterium]|nr:S1 RNA-binding domain-containing protein [Oscillospiraceae bacterium]
MQFEVGSILEGKVTGILKFGAFVDLGGGKSGMVHISEVSNTYVNDIKDVLTVGQAVKVKVLTIGEDGKISLSIKKAQPAPEKPARGDYQKKGDFKPKADNQSRVPDKDKDSAPSYRKPAPKKPVKKETVNVADLQFAEYAYEPKSTVTDANFEDMLSKFKASSEDRMSDLKRTMDVKKRGRRGK